MLTLRRLEDEMAMPRAATFLQSDFWAAFKASFGWRPLRFAYTTQGGEAGLLAMTRRLAPGLSFAYLPRPDIPAEKLAEAAEALRPYLPADCAFLRFDLPLGSGGMLPAKPLRKAFQDVQPPDTVIIDLRADEEAILAAMKPKWRYNVRLAQKRGVTVGCLEAGRSTARERRDALDAFYELYRVTALRDGISLHAREYYQRLLDLASESNSGADLRLWTARLDGRSLAAIITLYMGEEAVYLYGASSDEGREHMPAYALQWEAIRAAKAAGCLRYDLFGIPPSDDEGHPMHGLYRFKTGFGGGIVHSPGCWDYPLRPLAYIGFRGAEALRYLYYKVLKKRLTAARG
jgi:lipid II:glycine glycyltransferase (peptidoglycan interpeptide bridge formation enzyme)